jgi:chromosome segregation ATPase
MSASSHRVTLKAMEEGREGSSISAPAQQAERSGCQSGRKYCCPTLLSTLGSSANGGSIITTGIMLAAPKPFVLYIAIAFNVASAAIHVFEGFYECCLKPRKLLEDDVDTLGKEDKVVGDEALALRGQLDSIRVVSQQKEEELKAEREATAKAKITLQEKAAEITLLTQHLEGVNQGLREAKQIAESWKQATEQVTRQLAQLKPAKVDDDVEALRVQLSELSLSRKHFGQKVDELGGSATMLHATGEAWGSMVDQMQHLFLGLSDLAAQKSQLLGEADRRILSLEQRQKALEDVDQRLQQLAGQYKTLEQELAEAKRQLAELAPIIKTEAFQKLLQEYAVSKL